jgi:glycosyltransferase involved in cell wall biosynthesis
VKRPLRVVMMMQGYHPLVGGAERQVGALAPLLQQQGVDVQIITRRYHGLKRFERVEGIPVHRVPVPGPKPLASLSYTVAALPLARRLRPDVIHAHELLSPTTTAITARRLFGVPVVVTAHRSGPPGDVQRLQQKAFGRRRLKLFREQVDLFTVISREIDEELASIGVPPERRVFIPNGVDTGRFAPVAPDVKSSLRVSMGLPEGPLVIFTGRFVPEKRVRHLIEIWPAVRKARPAASLLLLGAGSEEEGLRRSAGDGIHFCGMVDDVAPYLQAADLFVLPSAAEGLSVALLEALSTALPVVVTAVGGAGDVVESGENGWLVPPDDPRALQEAIVSVLGDERRQDTIGRKGRDTVLRDYSLPEVSSRLRRVYEALVPSGQPDGA